MAIICQTDTLICDQNGRRLTRIINFPTKMAVLSPNSEFGQQSFWFLVAALLFFVRKFRREFMIPDKIQILTNISDFSMTHGLYLTLSRQQVLLNQIKMI